MTGERLTATAGRVAKPGSNLGIAAALIGDAFLAHACAGYGVSARVSAIL